MTKCLNKRKEERQKQRRQNALNQNSNVFHRFIYIFLLALCSFYFCNKSALTMHAIQFSLASHLIRCLHNVSGEEKINIINLSMKENADKIRVHESNVNAVRVQDCARIYNSNADCGFCCSFFYFVSFSLSVSLLRHASIHFLRCVDNLKFNIFIHRMEKKKK